MTLEFRTIDLERHGALCSQIRAETFAVSFQSDALFWAEAGEGGEFYLAALRERMLYLPGSCVHAWRGDELVGMVELKPFAKEPTVGYVNTFYLMPTFRGQGLTQALENYTKEFFLGLGITTVRLTVSPRNTRAVSYYRKHGWEEIGTLPMSEGWLSYYNAGVLREGKALPPRPVSHDATLNLEVALGGVEHVLLMEKRNEY